MGCTTFLASIILSFLIVSFYVIPILHLIFRFSLDVSRNWSLATLYFHKYNIRFINPNYVHVLGFHIFLLLNKSFVNWHIGTAIYKIIWFTFDLNYSSFTPLKILILFCNYLDLSFTLLSWQKFHHFFVLFFICDKSATIAGAIKEAINTLRSENVNAFVLDLRDNRWFSKQHFPFRTFNH